MAKQGRAAPKTTPNAWLLKGVGGEKSRRRQADATPPREQPARKPPGPQTSQWLAVPGAKDALKRDERPEPGAKTSQWLAVPKPSPQTSNGDRRPAKPRPARPPKRGETRRPSLSSVGTRAAEARERWVSTRLQRAKQKLRAQEQTINEMKQRLKAADAARASNGGTSPAPPWTAPKKQAAAKRTKRGKLDLNGASFEELRDLGLSVTQSARLIAYRDLREGFDSLEELDEIPGFSRSDLQGLHETLTLSAG